MGPYFRTLTEITLFRSTFLRDLYNFVLWVHILEPLQRFHFLDPHFKGTITIFDSWVHILQPLRGLHFKIHILKGPFNFLFLMGPYFRTLTEIMLFRSAFLRDLYNFCFMGPFFRTLTEITLF